MRVGADGRPVLAESSARASARSPTPPPRPRPGCRSTPRARRWTRSARATSSRAPRARADRGRKPGAATPHAERRRGRRERQIRSSRSSRDNRPMCGIAGKVTQRGDVPAGLVEEMCEREVHRGPDSRGIHRSDGAVLGIQRLRIIDLETGDQPIYNEDRSVAVVFNGEIYNFPKLRADLERRGHSFYTHSDTEVIAHLYEERGPDLVEELNGMFSLAVWDERRRRLLMARDRVGKKPLFYSEGDGWLSFASELPALMVDPDVRREIDPSSIDCYLAYGYVPSPWAIWRDVKKLRPAHTLIWEDGQTRTQRYWELDYSRKRTEDRRELEEELRARLGASVRRRMIA